MAIKYLDAKRIRGSSNASETATVTYDLSSTSSPTSWTTVGSEITMDTGNTKITGVNVVGQADPDRIYTQLGAELSNSTWTCDFKYYVTAIGVDSASYFSFSAGDDILRTTSQDLIGMDHYGQAGSPYRYMRLQYRDGSTNGYGTSVTLALNTQYYARFKRTSATTVTLDWYTNSGRTGTPAFAQTMTVPATVVGLTHLQISTQTSAEARQDWVYDGDIAITNTTVTDEKATLITSLDSLGSNGDVTNQGADLETGHKLGTGCLDFIGHPNGTEYIDMTALKTNNVMTTTGTIAFWVKLGTVANGKTLFSCSDTDGTASHFYMEIESDQPNSKFLIQLNVGGTAQWACRMASGLLVADQWHHFAVTQDGTSVKVYLDGVDRTIQSVTTDTTKWLTDLTGADAWNFGRLNHNNNTAASSYPDMAIDDFAIWNTALPIGTDETTAGSVKWLWNTGTGRLANTISSGLKTYYSCDSATITNEAPSATSDLAENTLFEETDTRKVYFLQDNVWEYSGDAPMAISGLYAWYDANKESTITKDGNNRITNWASREGTTARDLTASATQAPIYLSSQRNGKNVVDLDAQGKVMKTASAQTAIDMPLTIVAVAKMASNNSDQNFLWGEFGGAPTFEKNGTTDKFVFTFGNNGNVIESGFAGEWTSVVCIADGSSTRFYFNNVQKGTFTGTGDFVPFCLGAHGGMSGNSDSHHWREEVGEVIIYTKALSASELATLHTYLAAKWDL